MEDPILNRNLEESKELQTRWNQFHDFANMAYQQGASKITPQAEMKFLELKSRIAMLHDGFISGVSHDIKTAQKIITIVADCIMLKKLALASDGDRQKFEFDWNECFMLINETVGAMDEEKKRLASINERSYRATKRREIWQAQLHNFLHSNMLKWGAIIFVIFFIVLGVPMTGIYNYYKIPTDFPQLKTPYQSGARFLRAVMMHDLEYHDWWEVTTVDKIDTAGAQNTRSSINKSNFSGSFMNKIGFSPDDTKARNLLKSMQGDLIAEQWNLQGKNLDFVMILFDTSANAKGFIEQWNTDLGSNSTKQKILDLTYAQRSANLVMIGYGDSPFRWDYIRRRYNLSSEAPNLLQ